MVILRQPCVDYKCEGKLGYLFMNAGTLVDVPT